MSQTAILVDSISKRYRIAGTAAHVKGASLFRRLTLPLSYLRSTLREARADETLWALRDISFDVRQGEVLGLVGRNGAGKSTLLKILARITEPTSGQAAIHGRIGSLLEVGTGFHPELTGRENVFLAGAILGMKRAEIERKFDAIVAFAEVERFIDTPVKRYSSGMYVRLAFSVAAHLEPEILLVDEVLAVGDLSFQQKCLNRIRRLTASGMTILLVSHNMAAIQSSCDRAILLDGGQVILNDEPLRVIEAYRRVLQDAGPTSYDGILAGVNSEHSDVAITAFDMSGEDGRGRREFRFGERIRIRMDLDARKRISYPMINFGIRRSDGVVVCNFNNWYDNFRIDYIEGVCSLEGWLPPLRLVPDYYEIHVLVWPWGGGHLRGEGGSVSPYAWQTFGSFRIDGIGLNAHDGVYQSPAEMWRFRRGDRIVDQAEITQNSVYAAFQELT